jgi:hypothetical protein
VRALPTPAKKEIQERLWARAEALDWESLTVIDRSKQYGLWVNDPEIGGVLAGYMDALKVKTYLKDTLMKPYARRNVSDPTRVLGALGVESAPVLNSYERPHGLLLSDNRVICWGKADDWKLVLMAAHERAFPLSKTPFATVLLPPLTRFITPAARSVVEAAARKLGVERLVWHDPFDRLEARQHRHNELGVVPVT